MPCNSLRILFHSLLLVVLTSAGQTAAGNGIEAPRSTYPLAIPEQDKCYDAGIDSALAGNGFVLADGIDGNVDQIHLHKRQDPPENQPTSVNIPQTAAVG